MNTYKCEDFFILKKINGLNTVGTPYKSDDNASLALEFKANNVIITIENVDNLNFENVEFQENKDIVYTSFGIITIGDKTKGFVSTDKTITANKVAITFNGENIAKIQALVNEDEQLLEYIFYPKASARDNLGEYFKMNKVLYGFYDVLEYLSNENTVKIDASIEEFKLDCDPYGMFGLVNFDLHLKHMIDRINAFGKAYHLIEQDIIQYKRDLEGEVQYDWVQTTDIFTPEKMKEIYLHQEFDNFAVPLY